jgi:outer membrane immunogenic protein
VNTGSGYTSFNDVDIGGVAGFFANGGNVLPGVKPSGVIGGGQIGYDWQFAPLWVLGFVADIQASDMRDSATAAAPNIGNFTSITESNSARVDWFGTVRAKAGFVANNNWLIYGTGGLAYGHVHANTAFNDPSFDASLVPVTFTGATSDTKTGWTAGAGIEYALSPNWTVGAEYLYVDLGTISVTETQATGAATLASTFTSGSKFRDNIARLIINYKFGGY